MRGWTEIGALADVSRLGARVVRCGELRIAVFRAEDDRVFALEDRCPHKGGPLSQGIVHGCRVACPLHNMVIDLGSGRAVAPDDGQTRTFPVKVIDGAIWAHLDDIPVARVKAVVE